jgi:twitching motility two-component system response regulator PilG
VSETPKLSGIKVMVIDDSNTIRKTAEIFLLQAGAQVVLAEDQRSPAAGGFLRHPDAAP